MSAHTAGKPSYTMRPVIGRFVRVLATVGAEMVTCDATVMDSVFGTNLAKRVRLQTKGEHQGKVLMPGQYSILEFLD